MPELPCLVLLNQFVRWRCCSIMSDGNMAGLRTWTEPSIQSFRLSSASAGVQRIWAQQEMTEQSDWAKTSLSHKWLQNMPRLSIIVKTAMTFWLCILRRPFYLCAALLCSVPDAIGNQCAPDCPEKQVVNVIGNTHSASSRLMGSCGRILGK